MENTQQPIGENTVIFWWFLIIKPTISERTGAEQRGTFLLNHSV